MLFSLHPHLKGHKVQNLQGSCRTSNFMRTVCFGELNSYIPRLKNMGFFPTDNRDKFKTITLLKIANFTNTHFTFCYHWPLANTPVCVWLSDVNWSWAATKSLCIINLDQQWSKFGELRKDSPSALSTTFSTMHFKYNPEGNNNKHSSTACVLFPD